MNKKIITVAAALAAASVSFGASFFWDGSAGEYQVDTGFTDPDDGDEPTNGYWYDYNDNKETADNGPGTSSIAWPTAKGNAYSDEAFDPIIDECQGMCGSATLGGPYSYPFVGVGFNISGGAQKGNDISSWGGICITYKSTGIAPKLEISPENEKEVTGYNNYTASLKIAATPTPIDLPWTSFKQDKGWGTTVDQATVLASAAAVKFKLSGSDGDATEFGIYQIGSLGACSGSVNPPTPAAIKAQAAAVKTMLNGRTLSFAGISSATAEVINLQGQVVLKSAVSASSALNLASLDAGVYMVRVAGQGIASSQKIVLK